MTPSPCASTGTARRSSDIVVVVQLTAGEGRFAIRVVEAASGSPARVCLRAEGEVDLATAPLLRTALLHALDSPDIAVLELDLDEVTFMDAQGVSALLQAVLRAREVGCQMRLLRPQSYVRRVLGITGVTTVCEVQ
jgi:anti-anti-sigma factor